MFAKLLLMELLVMLNEDVNVSMMTPAFSTLFLLIVHLMILKDGSSKVLMTPPLIALLFVKLVSVMLNEELPT